MARSGGAVATARVVDKQERQINLVLVLLNTTVAAAALAAPHRRARLRRRVRTRCARSSSATSASCAPPGIEIRSVPIDGDDQVGYRIEPSSFWLPDLGLDDDEARALGLAAATLGFGGDGVSRVLLDVPPAMPAGTLTSLPALPYLYRAIAGRCAVDFVHKGKERRVAPGTLTRHGDRWYLGAVDLDDRRAAPLPRRPDHGRPEGRGPGHRRRSTDERLGRAARRASPGRRGRGGRPGHGARRRRDRAVGPRRARRRRRGRARATTARWWSRVGWGLPGLARGWVLSMLHHAEVLSPAAGPRRGASRGSRPSATRRAPRPAR